MNIRRYLIHLVYCLAIVSVASVGCYFIWVGQLAIYRYAWFIVASFFSLMVSLGIILGRRYLMQDIKRSEFSRLERNQVTYFTLAGFSLTAMSLFGAFFIGTLVRVQGTLTYLSVALVLFLIAAYLVQIRLTYLTSYLSEILEWTGVLALGAAFWHFFSEQLPEALELSLIYWIMLLAVFTIGIINLRFYSAHWRDLDDKKD